jgi:large repetitive protein
MAQYAAAGLSPNAGYFGIRRAPYSESHLKNPFTFGHIRQMAVMPTGVPLAPASPDPSEVHNVGEIWTQTLFQAYINLLTIGPMQTPARTFAETQRRMADYMVQGMRGVAPEPTFVEQRDAILRPIYLAGKMDPGRMADFLAIARGFADRGLGSGAIAPPIESVNLNEAVEDFSIKGSLVLDSFTLDDSVRPCDSDGVLDANEQGMLKIKVANGGWETLAASTVTVTSTDTNLTFGNGGTATIASLEPYGVVEISIPVTAGAMTPQRALATLSVTMANPNAVKTSVVASATTLVNYDDKAAVSSSDDVESNTAPVWVASGPMAVSPRAWSRDGDAKNHYWHGLDIGMPSDEILTSPSLTPSATVPFVLNFSHRYSFEADVAGGIYYDGGVLEISEDNGATWKDAMTYAGIDPGYTQVIHRSTPPPPPDAAPSDASVGEANPLAGRPGFVSESPGFASKTMLATSLDFGMAFVGKTVKVRFRIGTDEGTGAYGWEIDNVSFGGPHFSSITNTPFGAIIDNSGICGDGGTDGGPPPIDAARPDVLPDTRQDTGGPTTDARPSDAPSDAPRADAPSDAPPAADVTADVRRDTTTTTGTTTGGGPGPTDDGCGCTVPGRRSSTGGMAAMLGALGALSTVLRRRRRNTH